MQNELRDKLVHAQKRGQVMDALKGTDYWPVAELYEWSTNYDSGKNPYCVFLDLIGYTEERFGVALVSSGDYSHIIKYKEADMIADALKVYADKGESDVYLVCEQLDRLDGSAE